MNEPCIEAIPAFSDNYIWLIHRGGTNCAVVDPGDAGPVERIVAQRGLQISSILITHHHPDHIGGLKRLSERYRPVVFGPVDERIGGVHHRVREGDTITLPELELNFEVLEVPGHTSSHIAFYGHRALFCGDTLFSVGCGRLFEGTAAQMQTSLDKLAALPADTRVYCAHEYTASNCRFALQVEPENIALVTRAQHVQRLRAAGEPTVPSLLGEERAVNPFLRSREPAVIAAARQRKPEVQAGADTLGEIRRWKDAS